MRVLRLNYNSVYQLSALILLFIVIFFNNFKISKVFQKQTKIYLIICSDEKYV